MEATQHTTEPTAADPGDLLDAGDRAVDSLEVVGETRPAAHSAKLENTSPVSTADTLEASSGQVAIPNVECDVSRLETSSQQVSASRPSPAARPHGSHTPASAAPTPAASSNSPTPDDATVSSLRSLSPEEKGRRLIRAAKEGAVGELEELLAAGADVGAREETSIRWTALHWAAAGGHVEVARRLLAAGAALEARTRGQEWAPLHCAAVFGRVAVLRLLLAAGADHDARESLNGRTALHWAVAEGQAEAAAALLEGGADRGARDSWGGTPLDVARRANRLRLVDLLLGR